MSYSIRPMRKADISQIGIIDREAFPTQWPPPNYQHELELQLAHYVVAVDETRLSPEDPPQTPNTLENLFSRVGRWFRPAGSAGWGAFPPAGQYIAGFAGMWVMVDEAHITNIAVRRQHQRRGLGKLLLISLVDAANRLSASHMTLEVRISNIAARRLYQSFGFQEVGIRRGYYLDNREDAVLMSTESMTSISFQEKFRSLKQTLLKE
ncbi:ribosomal protein S18-alanine N-acetyltransferase [Chloroflexota bacterium]